MSDQRIFTATLILGSPGSGKTSLLATFAEYLWETRQRILLLYSWDGGAIPTNVQKLMKHGLIRFWRVRTRSAPGFALDSVYQATRGFWPKKINAETGETTPAVDLVGPVTTRYTMKCSKSGEVLGHMPTYAQVVPIYCTPCKTLHAVGELTVTEEVYRTPGFELVGGVAYDGLTAIGNVVLDHMDHSRGAGQIGGEKSAFGGVVISGSVKFGGTNRADIGFGQTRCREAVHNSLGIPFLVEGPVFTALSMEATDEGGLPIVGAKLPGRAATDEASAWFGNVCEKGTAIDEAGLEHHALYLRPYTDPQNRRHLLKTSASPTGLPDKLVDPIGQYWSQANLGTVFKLLDADLQRAMAEKPPDGAPGLAGTPSEYGDPYQVTPAAQPAAAGTLAPLAAPATPAVPAAPLAAPAAPAGSAPPSVVARRRPARVDAGPAVVGPEPSPTTTPTIPPTPPTTTPPVAATPEPGTAGAPPPPPGMKPPQRAPGA